MGKGEKSDVYFDDGFFPEAFHPFFITFIAALVARHDVNLLLDGGEGGAAAPVPFSPPIRW